jgi:hypothetical protein
MVLNELPIDAYTKGDFTSPFGSRCRGFETLTVRLELEF